MTKRSATRSRAVDAVLEEEPVQDQLAAIVDGSQLPHQRSSRPFSEAEAQGSTVAVDDTESADRDGDVRAVLPDVGVLRWQARESTGMSPCSPPTDGLTEALPGADGRADVVISDGAIDLCAS